MGHKLIGLPRDLIIHPGETLLEVFEIRNMPYAELYLWWSNTLQVHLFKDL